MTVRSLAFHHLRTCPLTVIPDIFNRESRVVVFAFLLLDAGSGSGMTAVHPAYASSNRICLVSCRHSVRFIMPPEMAHDKTGQMLCDRCGQFMCS